MNPERRKTVRFLPQIETYVALRPDFTKLGRVVDISREGLAFHYIGPKTESRGPRQLDLFTGNNGFYIPTLRCKIIYDIPLPEKSASAPPLERRRCGLEFGEATEAQTAQLDLYFANHVAGEA